MKRLSVIVPCYRDSATLARALTSLERQTRPADEVIVVDDCSPEGDDIRRVLAGFPWATLVRNETNLGLAGARNEGLRRASGDIVAFLDADDEAHPQRFELQLQLVGERAAVACDVVSVRPGEAVRSECSYTDVPFKRYDSPWQIAYFNRLTGASMMAPAALLRQLGGYDAGLRSCEDFDIWLRMLAAGIVVNRIRLPLYIYHDNPAGLSRNYAAIGRWETQVIDKLVAGGSLGSPQSLRVGTVRTMWLVRQYARAFRTGDPELYAQAASRLQGLRPWPVLLLATRAFVAARLFGLHRFVR